MTQQTESHIVANQGYGSYGSGEEERTITDEMMELAHSRVGAEQRVRNGWNTEATRDAIRHFAECLGIDDPLYSDLEHASKTRWGGVIAPPHFYRTLGVAEQKEWTPEERERARDPMSGIHAWHAGEHIQWLHPVYAGDVLTPRSFQGDFVEKRSEFSGRSVLDYGCSEYWNQRGELVVRATGYGIRGGRQQEWGDRKKYADIEPQSYTAEDIAKIEADYDRMEIRGANPRYWEDVEVGEELTPTVYGPLTVSDMLSFASGHGILMRGSLAHKLAYEQRKKVPRAYMVNRAGIPDIIEAVHWDDGLSQRTGNPLAYDYGPQRLSAMIHVMTNWMGDDGWLRMLDMQIRRFVYVGDTEWGKGRVVGKEIRNGEAIVQIEVWVEDQRGRITAPGNAEVMLPSRELGPVELPPKFESAPPGWYVQ